MSSSAPARRASGWSAADRCRAIIAILARRPAARNGQDGVRAEDTPAVARRRGWRGTAAGWSWRQGHGIWQCNPVGPSSARLMSPSRPAGTAGQRPPRPQAGASHPPGRALPSSVEGRPRKEECAPSATVLTIPGASTSSTTTPPAGQRLHRSRHAEGVPLARRGRSFRPDRALPSSVAGPVVPGTRRANCDHPEQASRVAVNTLPVQFKMLASRPHGDAPETGPAHRRSGPQERAGLFIPARSGYSVRADGKGSAGPSRLRPRWTTSRPRPAARSAFRKHPRKGHDRCRSHRTSRKS